MNNDVYEKNCELLKKYAVWILEDLKNEFEDKINVCSYMTREQTIGLYIDCKERGVLQLGSQYIPSTFAKLWVDGIVERDPFEKNSAVFVFGFGSGEYISELISRASEETVFLVYEPSLEVMQKVVENIDLEGMISDKILLISNGKYGNEILHQLIWKVILEAKAE